MGAFSRGGKTQGDYQALDHDCYQGEKDIPFGKTQGDYQALDHDCYQGEKDIPFGMVDEETGQLFLRFRNSAKTSDVMVDSLEYWWDSLSSADHDAIGRLQIKADNGPESSGRRTQFLHRMVAFAGRIGKPLHLLLSTIPQQVQSD